MRIMHRIAFLLLLSLPSLPLRAKVPPIMAPLTEHEKAIADNPKEVVRWADEFLLTITPEKNPREWVRVLIIREYAIAMRYEDTSSEGWREKLGMALDLAQKNGYAEEEIVLRLIYYGNVEDEKGQVEQEKQMRLAVEKARAIGNTRLWVRSTADLARYLHGLGNHEAEALRFFRQVQDVLKNDPTLDRIEAAITKVKIGLMLDDADMGVGKTIQMYQEVLQEFRDLGLRQFQATMIFNIAMTFILVEDEAAKARPYFEELLRLCPEIEDWQTYATALANLSELDLKDGKIEASERQLLAAKKILEKTYPVPYMEFLVDYMVHHYRNRKMWGTALKYLDEATPLVPPIDKKRMDTIAGLRHGLLSKMGRHEEAYQVLKTLHYAYKKKQEQKEQEGFDKLKVELGLAVEEEKTKNLEMQNRLQSEQIKNVRRLQIASLILLLFFMAVMGLMFVAIRRGRAIKKAKEKMQQILDTIDEGLLTVSRDLTVIDEHSPFMQQLFPQQQLAGASVVEVILRSSHMNSEEVSMAQESLRASLGEDVLNWDFNSGHLPQELHLTDGRWISLHWQPIVEQGLVDKILLAMRDVTTRHQLEEKVARQQKMMQGLQSKVNEILSSRTQEVRRLLELLISFNAELRRDIEQRKQRAHWLRMIHTAKGEARGLGLKELSARIHQLEDALKSDEASAIQDGLTEYSDTLNEYKYLIRDVFGLQDHASARDRHLIDVMASLSTALRQQLEKAQVPLGGLDIHDHVRDWPGATLNALRHSLVHVLANAADHGYIIPARAGRIKGKPAWFGVEAIESNDRIQVIVRDHGVGLDLEQLRRLAEIRGFEPAAGESLADVVFLDGASTTEKVSETSGRGIGLSAVRALCRNSGGNAWFRSNDQGHGAMLILEFQRPGPLSVAS